MNSNTPQIARSKPANFNWEDPFLLEDQLTEEERMIRETANAYCQDKLKLRVIEANRNEVFNRDIMNEMGALGLLGSTIPIPRLFLLVKTPLQLGFEIYKLDNISYLIL